MRRTSEAFSLVRVPHVLLSLALFHYSVPGAVRLRTDFVGGVEECIISYPVRFIVAEL